MIIHAVCRKYFQRTLTRYFDATHVTAKLQPTFISKVNTAVQLATIAASLAAPVYGFLGKNTIENQRNSDENTFLLFTFMSFIY